MTAKQPWHFKPSLTEERLNLLAKQFWEIFYDVESTLATEDDCNYGRGAVFFGRSRQRLILLSSRLDWLSLTNPGMDVTLEVEGVPFRFFRDDHENPKKKGFWRRNDCDQLFAPNEEEPVLFRFIVERPLSDEESLEVYFIGYNALEEVVCEWRYGAVHVLHDVSDERPQPVKQQAAPVALPNEDKETDADDHEALG